MKILFKKQKKTKKINKKYCKKGGIFFTRTSKYKDIKTQHSTLQEVVDGLEIQLANCEEKLKECIKKYPGKYPMKGGIFGLSLASNYNRIKGEKKGLEQRINELNAAIEECNNKLIRCETLTKDRYDDWDKSMRDVREGKNMLTRDTEAVITPFSQEEFKRTQELANRPQNFGGKKRKTKKANKKRKGCSRRRC
jgi:flagellar capping protein FliD